MTTLSAKPNPHSSAFAFGIICSLLAATFLTACSVGDHDQQTASAPAKSSSSAPAAITTTSSATAAAPETSGAKTGAKSRPRIAGIVMQEDQFMRLAELGMKSAGEKAGAEMMIGNSFGTADKEFTLIDTYIESKVDAICVDPLSAKASIPGLKRASDAGIKVVTWDNSLDADFAVADIKSDPVLLGSTTGAVAREYIEKNLGGKANVALIEYVSLAPESGGARVKGFKQELAKVPGAKIVAEQDAWLTPAATDAVEAILTAHPETNVIWSANEGGTVGSVRAVRNANKAGNVVVFGTDMSVEMADLLLSDDNILQAVTGQKPFAIGEMAVSSALNALAGKPVEKKVQLPGELFTRQKPDEVRKYRQYLQDIAKQ